MKSEDLHAIWVRLESGESQRQIAVELDLDRKTVGFYAARIQAAALPKDTLYGKAIELLSALCAENQKPSPGKDVFSLHEDEIRRLLCGDREQNRQPMRGTTAWAVLSERYGLSTSTSYESFKRFVRERGLNRSALQAVARIEVDWGDEIQIDYAKMGTWPVSGKNRIVYAYLAVLSASRLPFVQFTTSQDQASFAQSAVSMLTFYDGTAKRFNLDNLKAGVLKPDVYDPVLNRTFAELCDHYGIIADPARIVSPKDKGKVERMVQVARELWKRLTELHPDADLDFLSELAALWSREEYGLKKHGTTGIAPMHAYGQYEKPVLGRLPETPYEVARWSSAKVHTDQFISVDGKLYGVPALYIGKNVSVRTTINFVEIFFCNKAIRRFAISGTRRVFLPEDFPAYAQPFEKRAYAGWLCDRARKISPQADRYITFIVASGSNLALRRAQACLSLIDQHAGIPGLSHVLGKAIAEQVLLPARLKILFEAETNQTIIAFPLSERGKAMGREAGYYSGS